MSFNHFANLEILKRIQYVKNDVVKFDLASDLASAIFTIDLEINNKYCYDAYQNEAKDIIKKYFDDGDFIQLILNYEETLTFKSETTTFFTNMFNAPHEFVQDILVHYTTDLISSLHLETCYDFKDIIQSIANECLLDIDD